MFSSTLQGKFLDERQFELSEPLVAHWRKEVVTVPVGFISDGASVPCAFQWYAGRWEECLRRGAIVHDYLYYVQDRPRREADIWMMLGNLWDSTRPTKAEAIYVTLRSAGWVAWLKNQRLRAN